MTGLLVVALLTPPAGLAARETLDPHYQRALEVQGTASLEELFRLYARSAESGNAVAQYNIAMMYSNGEYVNVDYQQAAYWFGKSAAQGLAASQYRLGEMYFFGRGGLSKDRIKALQLFEKAADNGDPDAQANLAVLVASGAVTEADSLRALRLLQRAAAGGSEQAEQYRRLLTESADGRFTPEQQDAYWNRQRLFWVEGAASYGVREAEEALVAPAAAGADQP